MADKRNHTTNGEKRREGDVIGHNFHPFFAILLQVTVELGRNIMSSMMVEFLPTFLMNLINQVAESLSKIGETVLSIGFH